LIKESLIHRRCLRGRGDEMFAIKRYRSDVGQALSISMAGLPTRPNARNLIQYDVSSSRSSKRSLASVCNHKSGDADGITAAFGMRLAI
jgi:hypothetical protein